MLDLSFLPIRSHGRDARDTSARPRRNRTIARLAASVSGCGLLALLSASPGCSSARVQTPVTASAGGNDPDQQVEFWHKLAEQPVTSYDDAFHALLLFAAGDDPAADYPGRVTALKTRGLLAGGFSRPATEAVDRGTLSVALAKALNVRGGLVMSVFGPSARYATKELEFLEVYPASSPNQTFSGSEFLAVISRAEEYQKAKQVAAPTGRGGPTAEPPEMELKRGGSGVTGPGTRPADALSGQPVPAPVTVRPASEPVP
jgi:hypothetical protein